VAAPVQAQDLIAIAEMCRNCRNELTPVVTLSTRGATESIHPWARISRHTNGHYLVAPTFAASVFVFDSVGRHLRTLGKEGGGPGEFKGKAGLTAFAAGFDTVLVFDPALGRRSAFTTAGAFIQSVQVPSSQGYLPIGGGRTVAGTLYQTDDGGRRHFHIISAKGELEQSLGRSRLPFKRGNALDEERRFALGSAGSFWVHHVNSDRFEQWCERGELLGSYERRARWFPAGQQIEDPPSQPIDLFYSLAEAGDGVWTVTRDLSPDWQRVYTGPFGNERPAPTVAQDHGMFDGIVELIDVRTRRVVAQQRFDRVFHGFVHTPAVQPMPLLFSLNEDTHGDIIVEIYRVRLVR